MRYSGCGNDDAHALIATETKIAELSNITLYCMWARNATTSNLMNALAWNFKQTSSGTTAADDFWRRHGKLFETMNANQKVFAIRYKNNFYILHFPCVAFKADDL